MEQSEQTQPIILTAVGDIMLGRNVGRQIEKYGLDYPFLEVKSSLKRSNIIFGNLEAPIVSGAGIALNSFHLRAEPGVEKALKQAGFIILSLANNHTSSSLPHPHCTMEIADLKGTGEPVVIFADGSYTDPPNRCWTTSLSVWKWESWGFVRQGTIRDP
ncbi:MAG: CapA family protein [Anaerolineae bacterium]|nr:CapA family protein [Gloeobacterales cyanobacterium ES-bin-313]